MAKEVHLEAIPCVAFLVAKMANGCVDLLKFPVHSGIIKDTSVVEKHE